MKQRRVHYVSAAPSGCSQILEMACNKTNGPTSVPPGETGSWQHSVIAFIQERKRPAVLWVLQKLCFILGLFYADMLTFIKSTLSCVQM